MASAAVQGVAVSDGGVSAVLAEFIVARGPLTFPLCFGTFDPFSLCSTIGVRDDLSAIVRSLTGWVPHPNATSLNTDDSFALVHATATPYSTSASRGEIRRDLLLWQERHRRGVVERKAAQHAIAEYEAQKEAEEAEKAGKGAKGKGKPADKGKAKGKAKPKGKGGKGGEGKKSLLLMQLKPSIAEWLTQSSPPGS